MLIRLATYFFILAWCFTSIFPTNVLASAYLDATAGTDGAVQAFEAKMRQQLTPAPKIEPPKSYAPEDQLDQLLAPLVFADVNGKQRLEASPQLKDHLGFTRVHNQVEDESMRRLRERMMQSEHWLSSEGSDLFDEETVFWMDRYWIYSTALVRLQPGSRLKPYAEYMFRLALARLATYTANRDKPNDLKIKLLASVLSLSPAQAQNSIFYAHKLGEIDAELIGQYNFETRNREVEKYPFPKPLHASYHASWVLPIAAGSAFAGLPGLLAGSAIGFTMAFLFGLPQRAAFNQAFEKRGKALEEQHRLEQQASELVQGAAEQCAMVFGPS